MSAASLLPFPRSPHLMRMLFLALTAVTIICQSQAFASSHCRFATGRRLSFYQLRGGSGAKLQPNKGNQQGSTPLTCVMKMPPQATAGAGSSGLLNSDDDNNEAGTGTGLGPSFSNNLPKNGSKKVLDLPSPNGRSVLAADPVVPTEYVAETKLPTDIGQFQLRAYRVPGMPLGTDPCVIYARDKPPFGLNDNELNQHVPVRIHDQCLTSEVFRSQRYVHWRRYYSR